VTQKNSTECGIIPQAQTDNYFNSGVSDFGNAEKDLAPQKIQPYPNLNPISPIFRPRNNNPQFPDRIKSRIKSAFYAALERGRTIPHTSILEREARRKWLAANFILPDWLACQLPDGAAALVTQLGRRFADAGGGDVEISNRELIDLTGLNERNVQRNVRLLEERAILTVERRPQSGARNLVNVYRLASSALKAWIGQIRALLIGWRERHGLKKEIESSLKPAAKPVPKTFEETEIALRQAGPSAFDAFLIEVVSKMKLKRRLE
jgi:hypothetical protein